MYSSGLMATVCRIIVILHTVLNFKKWLLDFICRDNIERSTFENQVWAFWFTVFGLLNLLLAKPWAQIFRRYRTRNWCHSLCVSFTMLLAKTNNKCTSNKAKTSSWSCSWRQSIITMKWRHNICDHLPMRWNGWRASLLQEEIKKKKSTLSLVIEYFSILY